MEKRLKKLSDRIEKAEAYLDNILIADSEKYKYIHLYRELLKELTEILTKGYNIKL